MNEAQKELHRAGRSYMDAIKAMWDLAVVARETEERNHA